MIRPIVTLITELRKPCLPVEKNENIKQLIQDLKDTLEATKGIGITANQIGVNKRVSYLKIPKFIDSKTKKIQYNEYVLINPRITEKDKPVRINNEGCISFQGLSITTRRYVYCIVEFEDENRKAQAGAFQDLEAFVAQHEIDHQNGLTIFDRKWRAK